MFGRDLSTSEEGNINDLLDGSWLRHALVRQLGQAYVCGNKGR